MFLVLTNSDLSKEHLFFIIMETEEKRSPKGHVVARSWHHPGEFMEIHRKFCIPARGREHVQLC